MCEQMTLAEAAKLIGKNVQVLRSAAQADKLNFATAFKNKGSSTWTYWVDAARLKRILKSDGEMSLYK